MHTNQKFIFTVTYPSHYMVFGRQNGKLLPLFLSLFISGGNAYIKASTRKCGMQSAVLASSFHTVPSPIFPSLTVPNT